MDRRKFLTAASAAGTSLFAGCGGGGDSVPGGDGPSNGNGGTTTTTTTVPTSGLEGKPTDMGSFTDWMVGLEEASLFLMEYFPRYSWLIDNLPEDYMKQTVRRQTITAGEPTGLLDPSNIDRYFYGFTDVSQLTYRLIWGSFDAEAARERATMGTAENGLGYEALDESVGDFDLFRKEQRVFGITSDMMVDVKVGFAEPVPNFETVVEAVDGEATTFPSMNDDYSLLVEALDGHEVNVLPNEAKDVWELGTTAFARQFTYASEGASLVQEVGVYGEEPTEDEVRSDAEENSGLIDSLSATIDSVEIDGRLAVINYEPISNSALYRGSGYTTD